MSDEHGEEAVEPEEVAEESAAEEGTVEEVSDEALDEAAGGFAAEYNKPPSSGF